jgi:hypothetical protein
MGMSLCFRGGDEVGGMVCGQAWATQSRVLLRFYLDGEYVEVGVADVLEGVQRKGSGP